MFSKKLLTKLTRLQMYCMKVSLYPCLYSCKNKCPIREGTWEVWLGCSLQQQERCYILPISRRLQEKQRSFHLCFCKKSQQCFLGHCFGNKQRGLGTLLLTWPRLETDSMPLREGRNPSVRASSHSWNDYGLRIISKMELGHSFTLVMLTNIFSGLHPS